MKQELVLHAQAVTDNGLEDFWIPINDLTAFVHAPGETQLPLQKEDGSVFWVVKESLINIEVRACAHEVQSW